MWKETIVMTILGLLHHERRKAEYDVPQDRRQRKVPLTLTEAKKDLRDSVDRFSQTMAMHKDDIR